MEDMRKNDAKKLIIILSALVLYINGKDRIEDIKATRVGNRRFSAVLLAELIRATTSSYKDEEKAFIKFFKKVAPNSFNDIDLYETWVGVDNFSQRIWKNRVALAKKINKDFYLAVKKDIGYSDFIKDIYKYAIKINRSNAIRLLRTEGNRIHNEAVRNKLVKEKFKEYIYCAILDDRTTETCKGLDGSIFNLSQYETGVTAPPMHPNCRSYVIGNEDSRSY